MESCPTLHSCINFSVKFLWQILFLAERERPPKQVRSMIGKQNTRSGCFKPCSWKSSEANWT